MVKKGRLPQVPWLSFLSTSAFWANILGDPPFGISIMAYYGLNMVQIWFIHFGISVLGKLTEMWQKLQPTALEHPNTLGDGMDLTAMRMA